MANNPKKVKDPTEVALSAIQEALNINDASAPEPSERNDAAPQTGAGAPAAFDTVSFDVRPAERPIYEPMDEPQPPRRPANDDRETIGQLLQALQKGRPARSFYRLATMFAAVWIVGCGLLTFGFLPSLQTAVQSSGGVLVLAGLAALFFAPVLLF